MRHLRSIAGILILGMVVAGCGKQTTSAKSPPHPAKTSNSQSVILEGAGPYVGQANLKKWTDAALSHPNTYTSQINAGRAEFDNGYYGPAIQYYQKAARLEPNQGEPYTNIGNVYRIEHDNSKAIQYYQESTDKDPSYGFGWYDWVYVYAVLEHNKTGATKVYDNAVKALPAGSPYLKYMQQLIAGIK